MHLSIFVLLVQGHKYILMSNCFVSLQEILKDRSNHKVVSHRRLVASSVQQPGTDPMNRAYIKTQLRALSETYDFKVHQGHQNQLWLKPFWILLHSIQTFHLQLLQMTGCSR